MDVFWLFIFMMVSALVIGGILAEKAHADGMPAGLDLPESASAPAQPAAPAALPAAPAQVLDLLPLGKPMGNSKWQLGIDKSFTAGACVQRELHDGQWLAGPCRDVLLLAKPDKQGILQKRAHMGVALMYNSEHGNQSYEIRAGVNVGAMAKAAIKQGMDNLPFLEKLADLQLPKFVLYLDKIATVEYAGGYRPLHDASVNGEWVHGPMFKLDLPLGDVYNLLTSGL